MFVKPLAFEVVAQWGRARAAVMTLPHVRADTPMYMPVGTMGTIKALTSEQVGELGCHVILGNTYHLGHRPGGDVLEHFGGLHKFMRWPRGLLTDSGGFQMVSLLKLTRMSEEGVVFQSPHDGSEMLLSPEHSMHIQNQIGADIMMQLDDVVCTTTTGPRVREACERSIRWLDRCIAAHKRPAEQNLFAIIQGGLDESLRDFCLDEMIKRDTNGYAIGGLSGGEAKNDFWRVVAQCTSKLPPNKPRYLMGVGTARFGSALTDAGVVQLRHARYANDLGPVDPDCSCRVCQMYSRAALHRLVTREPLGAHLLTYHNIAYQMRLMRGLRQSIIDQRLPQYVNRFLARQFPDGRYPSWAVDALEFAGVRVVAPPGIDTLVLTPSAAHAAVVASASVAPSSSADAGAKKRSLSPGRRSPSPPPAPSAAAGAAKRTQLDPQPI